MHNFDDLAREAAVALRQDLTAASFTLKTLQEHFGAESWRAFVAQDPTPLRLAVAEHPESKISQLSSFFVLAAPLSLCSLSELLPRYCALGDRLALFAETDAAAKADSSEAKAATGVHDGMVGVAANNSPAENSGLAEITAAGADSVSGISRELRYPTLTIRPFSFDVTPEDEWLLASDLDERSRPGRTLAADHVLGLGGAAQTMAALFGGHEYGAQRIENHVEQQNVSRETYPENTLKSRLQAWDLGCGCGVLSLRLSQIVERVVATDISARALWFTELNAVLNGVTNIETRLGSLAEAVSGEVFDLVVSNPPFVITPRDLAEANYEYRDGGMPGDELMREATAAVAQHLAPGASGFVLGNWEHYRGGEDAEAWGRITAAAEHPESNSVDVFLIERERITPLAYAQMWIRDGGYLPGSARYEQMLSSWLRDFASRDVVGVGFGWVLLHVPDALGAVKLPARAEIMPQAVDYSSLSAALAANMQLHRMLADCDDEEVASWVLLASGDVIEARFHQPGVDDPSVIELRQGGGLRLVEAVTPGAAALVGASDGELRVGEIAAALAEIWQLPEAEMRRELVADARMLLQNGFLRLAL